ncbi:MAG: aspartate/glutamate racemase family protein [Armatimonadota bacterium]|nr:aspartate/glutamate racemase family protein [Armatimonadota bacterium]
MRLCYLGGDERRRYLQEAASPGVIVERLADFTPSVGRPETIESLFDEALLAPWTVEMAVEAERRGYDAVITGCAGDPGVEAAREMVRIPVIGPGQAALHTAVMLGTMFGVLTPLESTLRLASALPVPVVNVLRTSVRVAELLVGSRLTHSKIAYPTPPARHAVVTS